jgi:hypothetical protein
MRVDHHAVADDGELARTDDARGQQRQLVADTVDDQRVAGIVAALEADHHIGAFRQPVDNLAFSLVAPLRPDDNHIGHETPWKTASRWRPGKQNPRMHTDLGWQNRPLSAVIGLFCVTICALLIKQELRHGGVSPVAPRDRLQDRPRDRSQDSITGRPVTCP